MVLRAFGGPLGLLFGALEGVFGLLLGLEIDPKRCLQLGRRPLGLSLASCCRFLLLLLVLMSSKLLFIFSWSLCGLIVTSHVDSPNLKNLSVTIRKPAFSQNRRLGAEDGPESVWGPSWPPFWCS